MADDSESKESPFSLLLDANAQRLFWGQLISQACDKLMSVGMIWVLSTRFDPRWVPWFIGVGALPHLLLASRSGKWINRWGALRTVIWTDALRGLLFIACALMATQLTDWRLLTLLLVATFISNVAGSFFNPAILTLPVALMEPSPKRDKLTALIDSCFSLGNVLGPLVSAVAYSLTGLAGMLLINALSYLFSALLALGIKVKESADVTDPPPTVGVREVLKKQPVIAGMLITFLLMNLFLGPLMIFMPWYARNVYTSGISGFARLEACLGIGTVAGGALLSFVHLPGALWKRVALSLGSMAVAYLLFTFTKDLLLGCACLVLLGFFLAVANVITLTFFQTAPESQNVATVMGLVNLISVASLPISMGVVGMFIDNVSVPVFATLCASIVIALAVSIRFIPGIQRI